jgi:hypothetical protein
MYQIYPCANIAQDCTCLQLIHMFKKDVKAKLGDALLKRLLTTSSSCQAGTEPWLFRCCDKYKVAASGSGDACINM